MFWMVHSEQPKGFANFSLLVCIQSILFGKLRGALRRSASLCWSGFTLRWLA